MPAKHLRISGHVQGVFFRATAQEVALRLHLCGWIKNNNDGTVEAHIQGESDSVTQFLDWCKEGPEGARVENVDIEDTKPEEYVSFEIHR